MVRCIVFDLGKVIVPFDLQRGYAALQPYCAYPVEEIPQRLRGTDLVRRFESGQVSSAAFVEELSKLLGFKVGYDEFCGLWSSIFLPETLVPESLVEALHRRYRVILLSNTNEIHFSMVRDKYPILKHFDGFVLSYEVGAMKPDPRIYREMVRHAQSAPEEIFYTDDIPAYVEAAKALGVDAVVFESAPQIETALRARGVEW